MPIQAIEFPRPVMNKSQRASETQAKKQSTNSKSLSKDRIRHFSSTFNADRNGGLDGMKKTIAGLIQHLSDPTKTTPPAVKRFVQRAITSYEQAVKASIGMPGYSDSVVTQTEASHDIPTLPLSGYQLIHRWCHIQKLASSGTTAGGFYAELKASDLLPFVQNQYFRVKSVKSWTCPRADSIAASFAGVQVAASGSAGGTEVMPIWSENWTPAGVGFAGIHTRYPLGDFPQSSTAEGTVILTHFTNLGGTGGVTGMPVVFHVEIETLC